MAKILIVEDEAIQALDIELVLMELGHKVIGITENGDEALEIVEREKPDIILLDIVIQGKLSGLEVALSLADKHDCKIIFMTALSDKKTIESVKSVKHHGFLSKPFDRYQLEKIIIDLYNK